MNDATLETYLATIYTDAVARKSFLDDPASAARGAGLSDADIESLANIDCIGLQMAAESYAHKRAKHRLPKKGLWEMLSARIQFQTKP